MVAASPRYSLGDGVGVTTRLVETDDNNSKCFIASAPFACLDRSSRAEWEGYRLADR